MDVEIVMREEIVVDRTKHVVRWESDAMEIDTEVPTVSNTFTITHKYFHSTDLGEIVDRLGVAQEGKEP